MLDFFKKKQSKVETIDIVPQEVAAMKTGEEVQFKDPKTGEFVYQRAISAEQRKNVMMSMQKNAQLANQYISTSRQALQIEDQIRAINKAITDSEKEINDTITAVRDELKLDRRWGLNMQLGVLERRDAPGG